VRGFDHHKEAGFTLIEMLVAMFIFALISVGSMAALNGSLQSKEQVQLRLEQIRTLELGRAIMAEDMANIILRENRDTLGQFERFDLRGGASSLLEFTRAGRQNPGGLQARGDIERVRYLFEGQALVRRSLIHENPSQSTQTRDVVLFDNLSNVEASFVTQRGIRRTFELARGQSGAAVKAFMLELTFENEQTLTQYFEINL
jgi:general secretion pathway protein J